jgi:hypothetical protein
MHCEKLSGPRAADVVACRSRIPIYGMFPELDLFGLDVRLANDAAIFVILFAKISAELVRRFHSYAPWR